MSLPVSPAKNTLWAIYVVGGRHICFRCWSTLFGNWLQVKFAAVAKAQTILYADLLADRRYIQQVYSKSVVSLANLQNFATNRFVYHILTWQDVIHKSVASPASLQQMRLMWFTTDKSKASLYDMLAACRIRLAVQTSSFVVQQVYSMLPANIQHVSSKSVQMWFDP